MYGFQCNLLKRYFGDTIMGEAGEHLKQSSLGHRVRSRSLNGPMRKVIS